jgi:hypothetical protein
VSRIAEWRLINPEIHQANLEEAEAYWQTERRKRDQQRGEINDLVQQLDANNQAQLPVRPEDESEKDQQESDEHSEESKAVDNRALAAVKARKERKATSTKVVENESIESGMSGMSVAESRKKRGGRLTTTAAETATARMRSEEMKMKTRSTSLGRL